MIQGEKVRLRAVDDDDLERWWRWYNDWEVGRQIVSRYPSPKSAEREDLRHMMKREHDHMVFAIETHEGELIGGCTLCDISWEDRRAQLGIAIGAMADRTIAVAITRLVDSMVVRTIVALAGFVELAGRARVLGERFRRPAIGNIA